MVTPASVRRFALARDIRQKWESSIRDLSAEITLAVTRLATVPEPVSELAWHARPSEALQVAASAEDWMKYSFPTELPPVSEGVVTLFCV